MVEDTDQDFEDIKRLQECELPLSGIYFTKEVNIEISKKFKSEVKKLGVLDKSYQEISFQQFQTNEEKLKGSGILPEIYDYSELPEYAMVCKIVGQDKLGNYTLSE